MPLYEPEHALIGAVIDGRYRIIRLIGKGGMGAVYEAEAVRLKRRCACKVLLPEYTRDATAVARFEREAQAAARVDHPNVVKIHDTGTTPDGSGYIAMDLLRGESLDCAIRREGRLPWSRARHIALQICRGLAAAHAQGVVHRDLKPENCFRVTHDGDQDFIKIVDFGIAKLSDRSADEAKRLTATNSLLGTCAYMAHELVAGEYDLCDHRVDVWAAGVVLYEMLTGTLPFPGQNQGQIFTAILNHEPVPMAHAAPGADIPAAIEQIVAKALEKRLERRFRTIEDLARALADVDRRRKLTRAALVPGAADPPTLLPLTDSIDGMAPTLARVPGVTPRPGAPTADLYRTTALPPIRSQLRQTFRWFTGVAPRQLRRWIVAGALSAGATVAGLAVLSSASSPVEPSISTSIVHTASAMDAILVEPGEDAPLRGPLPADGIVVPLSDAAPAATDPAAARASSVALPRPRPRAEPAESYGEKVHRKLSHLARSAGVRRCLSAHEAERLAATIEISATTGQVVRLTAQLLMRGSALEKCVERESREWRFPSGGPTDRNYRNSVEFKAR